MGSCWKRLNSRENQEERPDSKQPAEIENETVAKKEQIYQLSEKRDDSKVRIEQPLKDGSFSRQEVEIMENNEPKGQFESSIRSENIPELDIFEENGVEYYKNSGVSANSQIENISNNTISQSNNIEKSILPPLFKEEVKKPAKLSSKKVEVDIKTGEEWQNKYENETEDKQKTNENQKDKLDVKELTQAYEKQEEEKNEQQRSVESSTRYTSSQNECKDEEGIFASEISGEKIIDPPQNFEGLSGSSEIKEYESEARYSRKSKFIDSENNLDKDSKFRSNFEDSEIFEHDCNKLSKADNKMNPKKTNEGLNNVFRQSNFKISALQTFNETTATTNKVDEVYPSEETRQCEAPQICQNNFKQQLKCSENSQTIEQIDHTEELSSEKQYEVVIKQDQLKQKSSFEQIWTLEKGMTEKQNNCYLNTALEMLRFIEELRYFIELRKKEIKMAQLICDLYDALELYSEQKYSMAYNEFTKYIQKINSDFRMGEEWDPDKIITIILIDLCKNSKADENTKFEIMESIQKSSNWQELKETYERDNFSEISHIFKQSYAEGLHCENCKTITEEYFTIFCFSQTLLIGNRPLNEVLLTLRDIDDQCYRCESTSNLEHRKQYFVLPKYLIVANENINNSGGKILSNEKLEKKMFLKEFDGKEYEYVIESLAIYNGNKLNGHYKACIYNSKLDEWIEYDDDRVKQIELNPSLQTCRLLIFQREDYR